VNLDNAVHPELHFDVQREWGPNIIAAGVLPSPDADLEALELGGAQGSGDGWIHFNASLSRYVGSRPWVVLWIDVYPETPILIGNLRVLDGEGPPQGDDFPTGHPLKDGWAAEGFMSLPYIQRTDFSRYDYKGLERTWQPLIDCRGGLELVGSDVIEPAGMGRRADSGVYKEAIDPDLMRTVDEVGAHGGNIHVEGGDLRMRGGSRVVNAPITGREAGLLVVETELRGDHDLVSLHNVTGGFANCTFRTDPLDPSNPFNNGNYRLLWALNVETTHPGQMTSGQDAHLSVRDCVFTDTPMALELSRADVALERNTFRHVPGMAVWDHMCTGLGGWVGVGNGNTFEDMGTWTYMRSSVTDVEFLHPDRNATEIKVHSGTSIDTGLDLHSPLVGVFKNFHGNRARYILPDTLVLRTGEVQTSEGAEAEITWEYNSTRFLVNSSDRQMTVDLEELFAPDPPEEGLRAPMDLWVLEPSYLPGVYEVMIAISDLQGMRVIEPVMRFQVNGEVVAEVNLTDDMVSQDAELFVWQNLTLGPGWKELVVTVWGRESLGNGTYSEDPVQVDELQVPLLMMEPGLSYEPWKPLEARYVVVPPGMSVELDEMSALPGDLLLNLKGWEGSSVSVDCSGIPRESRLNVLHSTELTVELANASVHTLKVADEGYLPWLEVGPGSTTLRHVVASELEVVASERDIIVSGARVDGFMKVSTEPTGLVEIANSVFEDAQVLVWTTYGDLVLRNCTVYSNWSRPFLIHPTQSNLTIDGCTVVDTNVMVFFNNFYWATPRTIDVSDCEFSGEDALLYVGWDVNNVDAYDVDPDHVPVINGSISGNTFRGCDVVLSHGQYGNLWKLNVLEDGARTHALFITRLQVIPPDGTPFWGAYTFIPREGTLTDWPFSVYRWVELDGEILADVQMHPVWDTSPPTLDVLLYSLTGEGRRIVRGFSSVVPNQDNDEATYPVMPDIQDLVRQNLVHWPPLEKT
jgi:hypothetical protein